MTPNNANPIAVIDSGIGGMSTLSYISKTLPLENIIYVADSNYAPYGGKTNQEITLRMSKIFDFLVTKNTKLFVMACNTATAASISKLREVYSHPIVGMEPAVKPALAITKNKNIGILATAGTLKSSKFSALLDAHAHDDINFFTQPCYGLVEFIENGDTKSRELKTLLEKYLNPLVKDNIDTLILGCTHYWFIKDLIVEIIGDKIQIIDTNQAVANHVKNKLETLKLLNNKPKTYLEFWTNSQNPHMEKIVSNFWGNNNSISYMGNWESK